MLINAVQNCTWTPGDLGKGTFWLAKYILHKKAGWIEPLQRPEPRLKTKADYNILLSVFQPVIQLSQHHCHTSCKCQLLMTHDQSDVSASARRVTENVTNEMACFSFTIHCKLPGIHIQAQTLDSLGIER